MGGGVRGALETVHPIKIKYCKNYINEDMKVLSMNPNILALKIKGFFS